MENTTELLEITDVSAERYLDSNILDTSNVAHVSYVVLLCLNTLTGNIGNIFVIGAIVCDKRLRKECNMFILNLAVADLCVTAFVEPFQIAGAFIGPAYFHSQMALCDMIGSICLISCTCSLYSIAAISVNRYVLICRRAQYYTMFSYRNTTVMIICLWIIGILLDLPNFFNWGGHSYDMKTLSCSYDRTADYSYTVFFICIFVCIPLFTVIFSNTHIYMEVIKSKRRINVHKSGAGKTDASQIAGSKQPTAGVNKGNNSTMNDTPVENEDGSSNVPATSSNAVENKTTVQQKKKFNLSAEVRLAKTLFIVFILFLICWAPYGLLVLIDAYDNQPTEAYMFCILIAHLSSTLNSIVYAVMNKTFRDGYKMFLNKIFCCNL